MKRITFPPPTTLNGKKFTLHSVCVEFVFGHEFWRDKANVRFCLSLMDKLETKQDITDDEQEALEKGMRMPGQVVSPELNRYYLTCLQAVYLAETVSQLDPAAPPEAPPGSPRRA